MQRPQISVDFVPILFYILIRAAVRPSGRITRNEKGKRRVGSLANQAAHRPRLFHERRRCLEHQNRAGSSWIIHIVKALRHDPLSGPIPDRDLEGVSTAPRLAAGRRDEARRADPAPPQPLPPRDRGKWRGVGPSTPCENRRRSRQWAWRPGREWTRRRVGAGRPYRSMSPAGRATGQRRTGGAREPRTGDLLRQGDRTMAGRGGSSRPTTQRRLDTIGDRGRDPGLGGPCGTSRRSSNGRRSTP